MADSKISALPASTTPLAGTEVLPVVQSSTTKQVSVANLTAGRAVSALSFSSTTGATFASTSGGVAVGNITPVAKIQASIGTGAVAPTSITKANAYLGLGGPEFNTNSYRLIGFGYSNTEAQYPAYMGYLETNSSGTTNGALSFFTRNVTTDTAPTERVRIASAGQFYVIADATTSSAANVFIDTATTPAGQIKRSTSSLRYKTNVQDAVHGLAEVLQMRPVTYQGVNDGEKVFGGLIAEEIDAIGLTEFVMYDSEGRPDALHYGPMVALLAKAVQELSAKVDELTKT